MFASDCGLWDGGGITLPFAHTVVLWAETHGFGRFGVLDLNVLTPLVGCGRPRDAHAAGTLARAAVSVEPGKIVNKKNT